MDIYRRIRAAYGAYTGEKRVIGRSLERRALFAFRAGEGRPLGIAVYAIHAREWVTALLALGHLKRSVPFGSVWFVPLMDPDGALLVQRGVECVRPPRLEALLSLNGGDDFSLWKANAEGTDLNVNFPARWGARARKLCGGVPFKRPRKPRPRRLHAEAQTRLHPQLSHQGGGTFLALSPAARPPCKRLSLRPRSLAGFGLSPEGGPSLCGRIQGLVRGDPAHPRHYRGSGQRRAAASHRGGRPARAHRTGGRPCTGGILCL